MCRKNLTYQFALIRDYKLLLFKRIISAFLDQFLNIRLSQEEFIEPSNLRQHLQVSEILRLKVSFSAVRRLIHAAKLFPQFAISRIAPDEVCRIGLKKVLQCEFAFAERK